MTSVADHGDSATPVRGPHDSPRWCGRCQIWGDHHTDRCPGQEHLIAQLPQRQDALDDQLRDVARMANRMGCYDAADWIKRGAGLA